MGINECSKPASKSSWDSQDFGDVNMVLKMVHFRKSSRPQWVNSNSLQPSAAISISMAQHKMAVTGVTAVLH